MHLEVEQKFRAADADSVRREALRMGGEALGVVEQSDEYFAHPARDFAQTDEALRVRRVGDEALVTYKGPRLDAHTKTRRELELPLGAAAEEFPRLLEALGFTSVATVRKRRERLRVACEGRTLELALDEVEGLGAFVELETLAEESELADAQHAVSSLADRLGLTQSERRSYLELLLEETARR